MRPLRVYVDTCVFGGAFDQEFAAVTQRFFEQVKQGRFSLVISATVVAEISEAPAQVQEFFESLITDYLAIVPVSPAARQLQQCYLDAEIVTAKYADDALHVAVATISDCALIISWNFKHIVHFQKIPKYNAVNLINGYRPLAIYSPLEVLEYED